MNRKVRLVRLEDGRFTDPEGDSGEDQPFTEASGWLWVGFSDAGPTKSAVVIVRRSRSVPASNSSPVNRWVYSPELWWGADVMSEWGTWIRRLRRRRRGQRR